MSGVDDTVDTTRSGAGSGGGEGATVDVHGALREFAREQAPLVAGLAVLGCAVGYWQYGFVPGLGNPFPVAGVEVSLWHLVWMGFWTGYTLAIVGEAAGIFALPYSMSVLQFTGVHITPTTQLLTLLNPLGALFGYARNRQANWDLAFWVCVGGVLGGLGGPFLRLTVLSEPAPFRAAVGIALLIAGLYLLQGALSRLGGKRPATDIERKVAAEFGRRPGNGAGPQAIPARLRINTVSKSGAVLTIEYWGTEWRLYKPALFGIGAVVGVAASALGVGGGFVLAPLLVAGFGLPMYVLVAAAIPFVICLSATSIITYLAVLPALLDREAVQPEWAWSFFAAAGGVLGAWLASKTQRFVPESFLKLLLGILTSVGGILYVLDVLFGLPFDL